MLFLGWLWDRIFSGFYRHHFSPIAEFSKNPIKKVMDFRSWDNFYCIYFVSNNFQIYGNQNAFEKPLQANSRGTSVTPPASLVILLCKFSTFVTVRSEIDKYAAFTNAKCFSFYFSQDLFTRLFQQNVQNGTEKSTIKCKFRIFQPFPILYTFSWSWFSMLFWFEYILIQHHRSKGN
jgi:hypothetical protein